MTTSYMRYILIMCNPCVRACVRACVCERACASASVIKRSLIFERILFKFGGDITSHKTDPHRLHALFNLYVNACPNSAHLFTFTNLSGYTFPHFSTDLLQIWRESSTGHDTFRGLYMLCVHSMWAHARAC
jgi:hypothetical protein